MNNFSKMIVNIVANSKDEVTLIPNYSGGFIRKDIELVKFLSYVVNLKYDRINELLSKGIRLLSENEIEELNKFREQERYCKLLNKYLYDTKNCTVLEYKNAYTYLYEHNINELVSEIFSEEELSNINKIVSDITFELDKNEITKYLSDFNTNTNLDGYNNLEIGDAYLLHLLQNKHKSLCEEDHKKELIYEKNRNDLISQKNMRYLT